MNTKDCPCGCHSSDFDYRGGVGCGMCGDNHGRDKPMDEVRESRECIRCGDDFVQANNREWIKKAHTCPTCRNIRPVVGKKEMFVPSPKRKEWYF